MTKIKLDSIRHGAHALDWDFIFFFLKIIDNIGDKTSIRPIWSVIIIVIRLSGVE